MPLESEHFRDNDRLQDCLDYDEDHVPPGESGDYVALIQSALIQLGIATINASEISRSFYGPSTTQAVLRYKGPPRNIINRTYEKKVDPIVGKMTIAWLDREMKKLEDPQKSLLISQTEGGPKHEHSKCPSLQIGGHERIPINPQNVGLMVNIYGAGETDYWGFKDYAIDPRYTDNTSGMGVRPLTWVKNRKGYIADSRVSDLCMRSSPAYTEKELRRYRKDLQWPYFPSTAQEIYRIGMLGCRITFAGEESQAKKLFGLGPVLESGELPSGTSIGTYWVISMIFAPGADD